MYLYIPKHTHIYVHVWAHIKDSMIERIIVKSVVRYTGGYDISETEIVVICIWTD